MEEQKAIPPYMDYDVRTEETMKEIKMDIPKGYEFAGVDDDRQQVVFQKIRPEYPKTYAECSDLCMGVNIKIPVRPVIYRKDCKNMDLLGIFPQLYFCLNAYWKIAGEQMGLGKLWEPDWSNTEEKFCIFTHRDQVVRDVLVYSKVLLAFPTEEMRDTFYENFKELIEECKELL